MNNTFRVKCSKLFNHNSIIIVVNTSILVGYRIATVTLIDEAFQKYPEIKVFACDMILLSQSYQCVCDNR